MKHFLIALVALTLTPITIQAYSVSENEEKGSVIIDTIVVAQNETIEKTSFFKTIRYDFSIGYGTKGAGEPFKHRDRITLNFGLDIIKPIITSENKRRELAGLVGLHFVNKGGSTTPLWDIFDDDVSTCLSVYQLSVPFHVVGTYYFKRCSLWLDLGPFVAFTIGGSDFNGIELNSFDAGWGFTFGFRFHRFGISFGLDQSFTNIAKYYEDPIRGGITAYANLRWFIGGKKKKYNF